MATCPKGHDSATTDYCDECGTPMAAGPRPTASPRPSTGPTAAPVAVSAPAVDGGGADGTGASCPYCGTPRAGRFCEEDGYDFVLAPPVPSGHASAPDTDTGAPGDRSGMGAGAPAADDASEQPSVGIDPSGYPLVGADPFGPSSGTTAGSGAPVAPDGPGSGTWHVVVTADPAYFEAVRRLGGEDAEALAFPRFVPERRFTLAGQQVLIGRRSRSRGVEPEIDLVGPPEDPGVSHTHALLVPHEGGWAVVDLESANGTYHNDPDSSPLAPHTPVPLSDGDRVYVGAWTRLSVRVTA